MTMRLSESLIDAAFESHAKHYGSARLWTIPYHVECWSHARDAFDDGSDAAFRWLYDELRNKWQVFRSKNFDAPSPETVRELLGAMPAGLRNRRLSDMADSNPAILDEIWTALAAAAELKRNKDGPSLVAVTKFLHFWNPRLFVIADREVVWEWVFEHGWIWEQVEQVRRLLYAVVSPNIRGHKYFSGALGDYMAVLVWGGQVLRENPYVCNAFASYVERMHSRPIMLNLREYEGAALEWLLLGLVELPPTGVDIG